MGGVWANALQRRTEAVKMKAPYGNQTSYARGKVGGIILKKVTCATDAKKFGCLTDWQL